MRSQPLPATHIPTPPEYHEVERARSGIDPGLQPGRDQGHP